MGHEGRSMGHPAGTKRCPGRERVRDVSSGSQKDGQALAHLFPRFWRVASCTSEVDHEKDHAVDDPDVPDALAPLCSRTRQWPVPDGRTPFEGQHARSVEHGPEGERAQKPGHAVPGCAFFRHPVRRAIGLWRRALQAS